MRTSQAIGSAITLALGTLMLAGCVIPGPSTIEPPVIGEEPSLQPSTSPIDPTASGGAADPTAEALMEGTWSGEIVDADSVIDLTMQFEPDGTLYISKWNDETDVPYDFPGDVWSLDGIELSFTLADVESAGDITMTGIYAAGAVSFTMNGSDSMGGSGYSVSLQHG